MTTNIVEKTTSDESSRCNYNNQGRSHPCTFMLSRSSSTAGSVSLSASFRCSCYFDSLQTRLALWLLAAIRYTSENWHQTTDSGLSGPGTLFAIDSAMSSSTSNVCGRAALGTRCTRCFLLPADTTCCLSQSQASVCVRVRARALFF